MKKLLAFLLSLSFIFAGSVTAQAAEFASNAESELEYIKDEIIIAVNEVYRNKIVQEVTSEDIMFSEAYKVYVDTNVFELSTNNTNEIESALDSGNYIYLVPVNIGKGTVIVNVQKGLPLSDDARAVLTEQEQQEVLSKVGKWLVSSLAFYDLGDTRYDYSSSIINAIGEVPEGTMLVGSLPMFHNVVALVPGDDGEIESLIPIFPSSYDISKYSQIDSNSNIYDYEQIKEYVNSLPPENPEMNAEAGVISTTDDNSTIFIPGVAVSLLLVAALFVVWRKTKTTR